jgi:alpha-ribazole phosphatase
MTRWWWVRHGPTHQKSFCGWRDVPADLSDTAMIARLNAYLPDDAVVVSSDLIRAVATADTLGRTRLDHARDIREFDFGIWDGMHFTEVEKRDPVLSRSYWENPGDIRAPKGESWNDVAERVAPWVEKMNRDYAGRNIIAVAHFGTILTQVRQAMGCSAYDAMAHPIDNLSVSDMSWDGTWRMGTINHVA